MFGLGFQEVLLILVIIFLLFGVKRLPDIGKGLGETMREIRKIRDERTIGKEKEKEKGKGNQKGQLISKIKKAVEEIPGLKEAKEIHRLDFLKSPVALRAKADGRQPDHEQSWRAFKGKNLEKLVVHIIKD